MEARMSQEKCCHGFADCCTDEEIEAEKQHQAKVRADAVTKYVKDGFFVDSEREYDPDGDVPSQCECGHIDQDFSDHYCYVIAGEMEEARHQAEYECTLYPDDFEYPEHFTPEY
jgi:hypothetical protein